MSDALQTEQRNHRFRGTCESAKIAQVLRGAPSDASAQAALSRDNHDTLEAAATSFDSTFQALAQTLQHLRAQMYWRISRDT